MTTDSTVRITHERKTMWLCSAPDCGGVYTTVQERCSCGAELVDVAALLDAWRLPTEPKTAGARIRAILLALRDPLHDPEQERIGWNNYGTDNLRREALDHAGFCWSAPGEMAPRCCCDWSVEKPEGPREAHFESIARRKAEIARLCGEPST